MSKSRQNDGLLALILTFFIGVGDFALLISLKEKHLGNSLVSVDFGR
jgi:hypothetical protein